MYRFRGRAVAKNEGGYPTTLNDSPIVSVISTNTEEAFIKIEKSLDILPPGQWWEVKWFSIDEETSV